MFEKKDYLEYFKKIEEIEDKMVKDTKELLDNIKNEDAKKILQKVLSDEKRHSKIARSILDLIE